VIAKAPGVLLEHVGDLALAPVARPRRSGRRVAWSGLPECERDREDRQHDGDHDDDPGGKDGRGRFVDG